MARVRLRAVSQVRCGDKGNTVNIALFAPSESLYRVFLREVTPERVKAHFRGWIEGEVIRYEVPNLLALNFVCREALGGGGAGSIRVDNLGKCFGTNLQRMEIEVEDEMLQEIGGVGNGDR
ncbi:hypothetical protein CVV65_07800 [Kyrpidia spormannii]|uniref:AtuA-like ferredoxin-fold domain-containing protein n=1 Tax=Kyrpidia spormannii TaxID=2055160 RepID=A0A2K8N6X2_9BACL|nr:hypothetical protein [Kyrpidia spormannii]ATY84835.1 hypothetical protein CVV65_07800 [Kyrpidia spormannii]